MATGLEKVFSFQSQRKVMTKNAQTTTQLHSSYTLVTAAAAKSHQSCLTLCDPIDSSPPGSHPWDSPGKNTGVGCHFLLQCMNVKSESEVAQSCPTLSDPMDRSLPGSSVCGNSPGKSTGVGCHCLLHS